MHRMAGRYALVAGMVTLSGCGASIDAFLPALRTTPAPLFEVPLVVEGIDVGPAIVDTGGGYEVMLKDPFGLDVVDLIDVLAFGGREEVGLTGPFSYEVGWRGAYRRRRDHQRPDL